jgi:hypothetical protein
MQYKTIVLELIQQHPEFYGRLVSGRNLLPALERYSAELRDHHQSRKAQLSQARPGGDPGQIASEALELALAELEGCLPDESSTDDTGTLSLDGAMAYLRRRTPPA